MCYNLYTQRRQYERYENTVASRVCGCHEPGICKRQVQEKVREEDIKITIGILRRLGHKDSEIEREIMQTYALSEKDTRRYL